MVQWQGYEPGSAPAMAAAAAYSAPSYASIIEPGIAPNVAARMATPGWSGPTGVGLGAGAGTVGVGQAATPQPSGLPGAGLIPAALGAAGIATPAWLLAALGIAGAGYGIYQALGGGEGGGIGGINLLGGDTTYRNGIPFGGPGLAEPPASMLLKEWHVNYDWGRLQYYLVQMPTRGRKIACYNTRTKRWKIWNFNPPHLAVIGKNMPSHKNLTRLRRNLKRHGADARTILKLVSPTGYAKQMGYRKYKKR